MSLYIGSCKYPTGKSGVTVKCVTENIGVTIRQKILFQRMMRENLRKKG